jgi:hypothetical protein
VKGGATVAEEEVINARGNSDARGAMEVAVVGDGTDRVAIWRVD